MVTYYFPCNNICFICWCWNNNKGIHIVDVWFLTVASINGKCFLYLIFIKRFFYYIKVKTLSGLSYIIFILFLWIKKCNFVLQTYKTNFLPFKLSYIKLKNDTSLTPSKWQIFDTETCHVVVIGPRLRK